MKPKAIRIRHLWRTRALQTLQLPTVYYLNQLFLSSHSFPQKNTTMASFTIAFTPATTGRVFAATAAKSSGGSKDEKGFMDWILGGMQKEDQFFETDPILKKVEDKNDGGTSSSGTTSRKNTVAVPQKKKFPGLGGLFAKN